MDQQFNVFVVSHTHWDREWYQTFQVYRKRLVFLIDELLEHMEQNSDYKYFHMDGQTIILEDYLAIRPEHEQRLKNLIQQGRIIIGPWYVMPDEFLLSGESLIRNLQKGFEISRSFGVEPMKCGYVVDIFGHNSQMPQILRGFGIDSAILWRGAGNYPKDLFRWISPDGSPVLCIKLDSDRSYGSFYFAIRWPFDGREYIKDEVVARMQAMLQYLSECAVSNNLLMMDGIDHIEIEPKLSEILVMVNENIEAVQIEHCTLQQYIEAQIRSGAELEDIHGELYDIGKKGVNNAVFKNVLSSMVHLKQMNHTCETLLTRWAEPFNAVANLTGSQDIPGFIEKAWDYLLKNHPHDSICGCSISRVHEDMLYRFHQTEDIANELCKQAFDDIVLRVNTDVAGKTGSVVVFNSGQQDFDGIVDIELDFPAGSPDNFKIFNSEGEEIPYQLIGVRKSQITLEVSYRRLPAFPFKDYYRVLFPAFIPAMGYTTLGLEPYEIRMPSHGDYSYQKFSPPVRYLGTMQIGHRSWENEFLTVHVNPHGTLDVTNKITGTEYQDLLIFEDCADVGDGWNYRKPLMDSRVLSIGSKTDFSIEYEGRFGVKWKIIHYVNVPERMKPNGDGRAGTTQELKITTFMTMKKGSPKLEFETHIDNHIEEHRMRVLFPTYMSTDVFFATTPFYLQERPIKKIDWSDYVEIETGVFPNQGVIILKDARECLGLYNKGLYEVEVTDDPSHTIALTLFRSFKSEVGRNTGEMSFMKRTMRFDYALEFKAGNTHPGDMVLSGEAWRSGIKSICAAPHDGMLPHQQSFLKIDIPGAVLSSFRTGKDGMNVLRVYNCTNTDTSGEIILYKQPENVQLLDLKEEVVEHIDFFGNRLHLDLKSAQIITLGVKM